MIKLTMTLETFSIIIACLDKTLEQYEEESQEYISIQYVTAYLDNQALHQVLKGDSND